MNSKDILRDNEDVFQYMERRAKEREEEAERERREAERKKWESGGPRYNCMHYTPSSEMAAIGHINAKLDDMLAYMGALREELKEIRRGL